MIRFLSISFLMLLALPAFAASGEIVTATITITNAPSDSDTIEINGDTRTWVTAVSDGATEILIDADEETAAGLLFNQLARAPIDTLSPQQSGTSVILRGIVGETITITISGSWGEYSLSTNSITTAYPVRVPGASIPTQSSATNIFSLLASDLGTYSTNAIPDTATLLENYVSLDETQAVSNKTITDSSFAGSVEATTLAAESADVSGAITGDSLAITNGITAITLTTTGDINADGVYGNFGAIQGVFEIFDTLTAVDIIADSIVVTNNIEMASGIFTGGAQFQRSDYTSLANGPNSGVAFGDNVFVKIDSGPTAAFSINGIAGGADGKLHMIYNASTYAMTIAHDSGLEATATNRIYTPTGADMATTGNGAATLLYDVELQRWIVMNLEE